jgi:hypothetical protein
MTNSLPTDPAATTVLAAVGTAIHHWEGVEAALATIYTIFIGRRRHAAELAKFGQTYKIFSNRAQAVLTAGEAFFIRHPDQGVEGRLRELVNESVQLSIERHRIGHGRLRALPIPVANVVSFHAPAGMRYLWGAEVYSTDRLKTDWLGVGHGELLAWAARFEALEMKLLTFACELGPSS